MPRNLHLTTSLTSVELARYTARLLENHFPDGVTSGIDLRSDIDTALDRIEHCFSRIHRKYYRTDGVVSFDHLNSDHMAAYLYFLGNTIWRRTGDTALPTRLFYLNKVMHGIDLYFSVAMPEIFLLVHPVGTVVGAATYGDYLVLYQNCTLGADAGVYPTLGEGVILYSRTSVLGRSVVGDNVVFAANSFLVNTDVPSDSLVVGQFPSHRIRGNSTPVRYRLFESPPNGG